MKKNEINSVHQKYKGMLKKPYTLTEIQVKLRTVNKYPILEHKLVLFERIQCENKFSNLTSWILWWSSALSVSHLWDHRFKHHPNLRITLVVDGSSLSVGSLPCLTYCGLMWPYVTSSFKVLFTGVISVLCSLRQPGKALPVFMFRVFK